MSQPLPNVLSGVNVSALVDRLVREYIVQEIQDELAKDSGTTMAVRVLGEVLAAKPGFSETVHAAAAKVMRELLEPKPKKGT